MKRFFSISAIIVVAIVCVVMSGIYFSDIDTVAENAKSDYGSCATHIYGNNGEYIVIQKATCTSKGTQYRSCERCSFKDIADIPKNPDNHSQKSNYWTFDPAPTCVTDGVKYKICYGCNTATDVTDVPAEPEAHKAKGNFVIIKDSTCSSVGEKAYECMYCDEFFGNEEIPVVPEKHIVSKDSVGQVVVDPECAKAGLIVVFCDLCGREAAEREIPATGNHTPSADWTVDKAPTCSDDGVKSHHCTVCDTPFDETVIPAVPDQHTFPSEFVEDKAADCISEGIMSKHCLYCDEKTEVYVIDIDPTAHSYTDEWIVTKEPTCSSKGLKHRVCTLCGKDSVSTIINETDHAYPDTYEIIKESADGLSAQVKYTCTNCGHEKTEIVEFGTNGGNGNIGDGYAPIYKIVPVDDTVIKVDHDEMIISNVIKNLTVEKFMEKFKNGSLYVVYDLEDDFADDSSYIGTGYRVNYETIDGIVTNYRVSVTGDLDSDGNITSADARLVLRASASLETLTGAYLTAADIDYDGEITASDARKVLRVAAGLEYLKETYDY